MLTKTRFYWVSHLCIDTQRAALCFRRIVPSKSILSLHGNTFHWIDLWLNLLFCLWSILWTT